MPSTPASTVVKIWNAKVIDLLQTGAARRRDPRKGLLQEMANSIDYVPIDIDMLDDPKVSALLDDLSDEDPVARFTAFGRLVAVLQHVYHDGFYMVYGKFERRKLAKDAAMTPDELDAFLSACVECELFDAGMWERGVITSRGVQERYFRAKSKSKSSVSLTDEEREFILDGSAPSPANSRRPARSRADSRELPLRDEKRSKEKRRERGRARGRGVRVLLSIRFAAKHRRLAARGRPALVPRLGGGPGRAVLRRRGGAVRHAVGRARVRLRREDAGRAHRPLRRPGGLPVPAGVPARPRER